MNNSFVASIREDVVQHIEAMDSGDPTTLEALHALLARIDNGEGKRSCRDCGCVCWITERDEELLATLDNPEEAEFLCGKCSEKEDYDRVMAYRKTIEEVFERTDIPLDSKLMELVRGFYNQPLGDYRYYPENGSDEVQLKTLLVRAAFLYTSITRFESEQDEFSKKFQGWTHRAVRHLIDHHSPKEEWVRHECEFFAEALEKCYVFQAPFLWFVFTARMSLNPQLVEHLAGELFEEEILAKES